MDARVVAALLLQLLVATARSSDNSNGVEDSSYEDFPLLFPDDEFTLFRRCLLLGRTTECIAYVNVTDMTVVSVGEGGSRPATDDPCRYYTCDSNIPGEDGDISCRLLEKSDACPKLKTQLEYQFLRDSSSKNDAHSTCVVLFLSNTIGRFKFDEQDVRDSCNASCSCEATVATTRAVTMDAVTNNMRPMSRETNSTARTTVAAATAKTISSSGLSIEDVSSVNTTKASSASVNESSINDTLTIENMESNATSGGKDNDETQTIVIVVILCIIVGGGILVVFLLCRFRRRSVDPQPSQPDEYEMTQFQRGDYCETDSEAIAPLMSTQDDVDRYIITSSTGEYPRATPTTEQPQPVELDLKTHSVDIPHPVSKPSTVDHFCVVHESTK